MSVLCSCCDDYIKRSFFIGRPRLSKASQRREKTTSYDQARAKTSKVRFWTILFIFKILFDIYVDGWLRQLFVSTLFVFLFFKIRPRSSFRYKVLLGLFSRFELLFFGRKHWRGTNCIDFRKI